MTATPAMNQTHCTWKKLLGSDRGEKGHHVADVIQKAIPAKLSRGIIKEAALVLEQCLRAAGLPSDILAAGIVAPRGQQRLRRLDPNLREAMAAAADAGPNCVQLVARIKGGLWKLRKGVRAQDATDQRMLGYLAKTRLVGGIVARVSVGCDGSRVGQEKTLMANAVLANGTACWLPPQAWELFAGICLFARSM